jgi:hypothetical protein
MNKTVVYSTIWFIVGAGIGSVASILILQKKVERHYQNIANEEINSVVDTYKLLRKQPPYDDPRTAVQAYAERMDELQYLNDGGEEPDEETKEAEGDLAELIVAHAHSHKDPRPVLSNIWDTEGVPEVMTEAEMEDGALFGTRSPDHPYVISFKEFMEDEEHYDKISIEWFEFDNTLADDREQIIPDVDEMVGRRNLSRFGQGSEDPNIVYVRNEHLHIDFEIAYNDKGYAEVVLDIDPEPRQKRRVPKMREDE